MNSWDKFNDALQQRHPGATVHSVPSLGSANSARFLRGGFKVGIPNLRTRVALRKALDDHVPWIYPSRVLVPGAVDSEMYFALVFSGENLAALETRLSELDREAEEGKLPRTNNTRFILHSSGFFATVMQEQDRIDPEGDPSAYGTPVPLDEILYADTERGGRLTPAEVDVVQRISRGYSAPHKIKRLEMTGQGIQTISASEDLSIDQICERIASLGGYYPREVIESFHLNLTHNPRKHFVILRGISGTGKSRLAKCYAFAVLGAPSLREQNARFVSVAVEPQWTDPTYLLGVEDVFAPGGYRKTPFLDALILADSDPALPVFVLLDEMNRAQVEHYFAGLLSAMELEEPIPLHASVSELGGIPSKIQWPLNLYIIGTVNDDESVVPMSPMVLDRANTQDLSTMDVVAYAEWLKSQQPELASALEASVVNELKALSDILSPFDLHFGNRTVRDIAMYITAARENSASIDALDIQIDQRILPKLRGGLECESMLNDMARTLRHRESSSVRVQKMLADLSSTDYFKYR